jgi:hypothetical protein
MTWGQYMPPSTVPKPVGDTTVVQETIKMKEKWDKMLEQTMAELYGSLPSTIKDVAPRTSPETPSVPAIESTARSATESKDVIRTAPETADKQSTGTDAASTPPTKTVEELERSLVPSTESGTTFGGRRLRKTALHVAREHYNRQLASGRSLTYAAAARELALSML